MKVQTFNYQFKGMRKPDNFIVYPKKAGDVELQVQGHRTIARFNIETGAGRLNFRGSNSKYGVHLNYALGAIDYQFPQDFINKALEFLPCSGDTMGGGGVCKVILS